MDQHLLSAAQIIQEGGVVAYPTESVYGLGCDPFNRNAVMQLLAIKHRPVSKGLILIGESLAQLGPYLHLNEQQSAQLEKKWPAPITYLVDASDRLPAWVRGEHRKVAVRVPDHPLARQLCQLAGQPIISTSANISGRPAARNRYQVARQLGNQLDFIVSGACDRAAKPSTIIDLESGRILRP
ncbi:hypothetical protein AS19_01380 [Alcanivorax sp. NBRC 101098]|uniref:L-threonylcarbamoyladenylate synthase n=1 Tax=Alcanivorax sp. NBRC 101098 TaxID=1113728 RepID=UPI0004ABDA7D|nr:L-threonylcarbamoyladenylate synthase [Alcanivorax sp. NBRC 101098]BAP12989.1 hypothetical protein AS19_01380 [Alcanivorax sp. NBRC 101098]